MFIKSVVWSLTISILFKQQVCYMLQYKEIEELHKLGDYCKTIECILKCCPENEIMVYDENFKSNCTSLDVLQNKYGLETVENFINFDGFQVYDKDIQQKITVSKKSANDFTFIYVSNFSQRTTRVELTEYLLEDGKFALRRINYWPQWIVFEREQFCMDLEVFLSDNGTLVSTTPNIIIGMVLDQEPTDIRNRISAYGMLVSCVFLVLVLAVYALLPELRNLAGLILMAGMSSYLAFFVVRIIHVFANAAKILSPNACGALTVIFHYLMLATFCWMNVMSFDIWWTFRSIKSCRIGRSTRVARFRWYCVYAWGLPLLATIFVVVVDRLDLSHIPDFAQPHLAFGDTDENMLSCYFEPGIYLLYVNVPVFILICVNLVMFIMTAFNIWEIRQGICYDFKDITNTKSNEHRFWVYLRLGMVMGVSWILEGVSNVVNPDSSWWCITDLYNSICGLYIFLLFVCKKKIFLRLCTRYSIANKLACWMRVDGACAELSVKVSTQATDIWPSSGNVRN